jgi:hypothetical protein
MSVSGARPFFCSSLSPHPAIGRVRGETTKGRLQRVTGRIIPSDLAECSVEVSRGSSQRGPHGRTQFVVRGQRHVVARRCEANNRRRGRQHARDGSCHSYLAFFPKEGNPPENARTLFEAGNFCFFFGLDFRFRFGPNFGTA